MYIIAVFTAFCNRNSHCRTYGNEKYRITQLGYPVFFRMVIYFTMVSLTFWVVLALADSLPSMKTSRLSVMLTLDFFFS